MNFKKLMSGFLAAVLTLALVPTAAFADNGNDRGYGRNAYISSKDVEVDDEGDDDANITIAAGQTVKLTLENVGSRALEWTTDDGNTATVSETGLPELDCNVTGIKVGTTTIRVKNWSMFGFDDDERANITVNVVKAEAGSSKVVYHANGGSGDNKTVPLGDQLSATTLTVGEAKFTRNDYSFLGWSKEKNASGTIINAGVTYDFHAGTNNLYAAWAPNSGAFAAYYYLRYDSTIQTEPSNYGRDFYFPTSDTSYGDYRLHGTIKAQVIINNDVEAVKANLGTVPTNDEIKAAAIAAGKTFDPNTQHVVWYVIKNAGLWHIDGAIRSKDQKPVTYDANGGKQEPLPNEATYEPGATVTVDFTSEKLPSRPGYEFLGWDTSSGVSDPQYRKDSTAKQTFEMPDSPVTLYAIWKAKGDIPYTVNHFFPTALSTWPEEANQSVSFTGTTDAVVLTTDKALKGYKVNNKTAESVTITADGKAVLNIYYDGATAMFHSNGGEPANAQSKFGTIGAVIDATPKEPTRTSDDIEYSFNGWNNKQDGTGDKYDAASTMPENGVNYYAQWSETKLYTLQYSKNYGNNQPEYAKKYADKTSVSLLTAPKRTNWNFDGWFDAAEGGNKIGMGGDSYTTTAADVTLYAHWSPTAGKWHNVSFVINEASGTPAGAALIGDTEFKDQEDNATITVPGYTVKDGYEFDKWQKDGKDVPLDATLVVTASGIYTAFFKGIDHTLTISYLYPDGSGITNPTAHTAILGTGATYEVNSPDAVDGYKLENAGQASISGTMPNSDVAITVKYVKDDVRWGHLAYDVDGDKEIIKRGNDVLVGGSADITTTKPAKEGYTFKEWQLDDKTTATDKVKIEKAGETLLTAIWSVNSYPYIVKYVETIDGKDTPIAGVTDDTGNGNFGTEIPAEAKDIPGYVVTSAEKKTIGVGDNIVYVRYAKSGEWGNLKFETYGGSKIDPTDTVPAGTVAALGQFTTTKFGYDFDGWSLTYNGDKVDSVTIAKGTTTLHARWIGADNTLTIKYQYTDGKTAADTHTETVKTGDKFSVDSPDVAGYKPDKDAVTQNDILLGWTVIVTYAKDDSQWHSVTYKSGEETSTDPTKHVKGSTVTLEADAVGLPGGVTFTVKDGYGFYGWTDKEGKPVGRNLTMGDADITVYADWQPLPYTFDVYHYTESEDNPELIELGKLLERSAPFGSKVKGADYAKTDGFFPGWGAPVTANDITIDWRVENNIIKIYYSEAGRVHVTYDGNGNDGGTVPEDLTGHILNKDGEAKVRVKDGKPSKTGSEFLGWYVSTDATKTPVGSTITISGDTTLVAEWQTNEYTLIINYTVDGAESDLDVLKNAHVNKPVEYGTPYEVELPEVKIDGNRYSPSADAALEGTVTSNVTVNVNYTMEPLFPYRFEYHVDGEVYDLGENDTPMTETKFAQAGYEITKTQAGADYYAGVISKRENGIYSYKGAESFTVKAVEEVDGALPEQVFVLNYTKNDAPVVKNNQINVIHEYYGNGAHEATASTPKTDIELGFGNVVDTSGWKVTDYNGNSYGEPTVNIEWKELPENIAPASFRMRTSPAIVNEAIAAMSEEEKAARIAELTTTIEKLQKKLAAEEKVVLEKNTTEDDLTIEDIKERLAQYEDATEVAGAAKALEARLTELQDEINLLDPPEIIHDTPKRDEEKRDEEVVDNPIIENPIEKPEEGKPAEENPDEGKPAEENPAEKPAEENPEKPEGEVPAAANATSLTDATDATLTDEAKAAEEAKKLEEAKAAEAKAAEEAKKQKEAEEALSKLTPEEQEAAKLEAAKAAEEAAKLEEAKKLKEAEELAKLTPEELALKEAADKAAADELAKKEAADKAAADELAKKEAEEKAAADELAKKEAEEKAAADEIAKKEAEELAKLTDEERKALEEAQKEQAATEKREKLSKLRAEYAAVDNELATIREALDYKAQVRSLLAISKEIKDAQHELFEFGVGEDPYANSEKLLARIQTPAPESLNEWQFVFDETQMYTITFTYNRTFTEPVTPPGGGGGGGGGGGNNDDAPTPPRPNRPTTTIPEPAVPLGAGPNPKLFTILDEDVPLGALPKSGGTRAKSFGGIGAAALLVAASLLKALRKKDSES